MTDLRAEVIPDDRTGFPLVVFTGSPLQVGLIPLTWVQLEYLLCDTSDRRLDAFWYNSLVAQAGRISIREANASNFPDLFVRGIMLHEAYIIGRWWGEDRYLLPSAYEWQHIRNLAVQLPMLEDLFAEGSTNRFNPRAVRIMNHLMRQINSNQHDQPLTLADQMLLNNGLRELVLLDEAITSVGGIGTPHQAVEAFANKPILRLDDGNVARRREVGLRLFLNE